MLQMMTAAELAEISRTKRGEPTYAELKAQRDELLAALELAEVNLSKRLTAISTVRTNTLAVMRTAIAKAKGE